MNWWTTCITGGQLALFEVVVCAVVHCRLVHSLTFGAWSALAKVVQLPAPLNSVQNAVSDLQSVSSAVVGSIQDMYIPDCIRLEIGVFTLFRALGKGVQLLELSLSPCRR